jgi:hypothetical protein
VGAEGEAVAGKVLNLKRIDSGAALVLSIAIALVLPLSASAFTSNTFDSPSGNIDCRALADYLNRPVMACTSFSNGRVAYIYRYSRSYLQHDNGQFGFHRGLGPTPAYNRSWSWYGFDRDSLVTGVQCQNLAGHGFKIVAGRLLLIVQVSSLA